MRDFGRHIKASKGIKDVIVLYNYLQTYHPQFPEKYLEKAYITKKLFTNEKNITKKFTNVMYRFGQLLDDFLVYEELKVKEAEKDLLLLHALKRRQLDQYFFKKAEQIEEDWRKNPPAGLEHLHNEYRLREMSHSHPNYLVKKMPIGHEDLIYHIDSYYFAVKLYWALSVRHNKNYVVDQNNTNKPQYLVDEILNICLETDYRKRPQIKLISKILETFKNKNFENYLELKAAFLNNFNLYNAREQYDFVILLYSICYESYMQGNTEALIELFDLNCIITENHFLLRDGRIQTDQFWNIVNIGFASNNFDWTEKFIAFYGDYLQPKEKEDVLIICDSMICYHKDKYKEAIQKLATVKFQNVLFGLYARCIQLKSYYELGDDYMQFKNFISFSKKLRNAKNKPHLIDNTDNFRKSIKEGNIAYKSWLIAKLEEIVFSNSKQEKVKILN